MQRRAAAYLALAEHFNLAERLRLWLKGFAINWQSAEPGRLEYLRYTR